MAGGGWQRGGGGEEEECCEERGGGGEGHTGRGTVGRVGVPWEVGDVVRQVLGRREAGLRRKAGAVAPGESGGGELRDGKVTVPPAAGGVSYLIAILSSLKRRIGKTKVDRVVPGWVGT